MRLGNRIYRVWEELELPKYFLNLHQNAPTSRVVSGFVPQPNLQGELFPQTSCVSIGYLLFLARDRVQIRIRFRL